MQTVWGVADETIIVSHVGAKGMKYRLRFADELVYAPMVGNFLNYIARCLCVSVVFMPVLFFVRERVFSTQALSVYLMIRC